MIRVALDPVQPPRLSESRRIRLARAMVSLAAEPLDAGTAAAVQVDFDAPRSARPFYRALLTDLRAALPRGTRLSMTALASWCLGDPWLEGLPVDEVVPMVFRMVADAPQQRRETVVWARRLPADPRLLEALHRAVLSARFGCTDPASRAASREAFQRLRARFPSSPWAAKTRYWYK